MGSREMLKVPNPLKVVAIPLLLGSLVGSPAIAQSPTYGVGRTPTAEELRRMDIAIGPTGEELPAGSGTAKEGAQVYVQKACICLLYTSPSPRDISGSRMPSSA